jgi:hypothetical protein
MIVCVLLNPAIFFYRMMNDFANSGTGDGLFVRNGL